MDPEYYDRQAAAELAKVAKETAKRADLESKAASRDEQAAKAEASAASTKSDSLRRSKARDASSKRKQATDFRIKAAAATKAAGAAQKKANDLHRKASDERLKRAKRADQDAKREGRDAERRAARERRERQELAREVLGGIDELRSTTDDLAALVAASRASAPARITVLLMAGTPEGGRVPLRIDRESREIDAKVRAGRYRDQIDLQSTQATQVRDIVDALNRYEPSVVHFSGHGGGDALLFEGRNGKPQALAGDHLGLLLEAAPKPIRLVVFNACQSSELAEAATDFADFAIGMETSIADDAAKEWAGQFYGSLAAGVTVGLAFRQAAAHATALAARATQLGDPQLYARPDADPETTVLVSPEDSL